MASDRPQVRFGILGALECWVDGERLRLGGATQERVLAMLLLEAGNLVTVPRLVEAAWDGAPPATASRQIRKAITHLRQRIPHGHAMILTDGPGYQIILADDQLDLRSFTARTQNARELAAAGQLSEAAAELQAALALWRGRVMCCDGGPVLEAVASALEEHRVVAAEQLFELRLGLGESGELVGDLRGLVATHPMREGLRRLLMIALYRAGRQAEALEEYRQARELLLEELGVDPTAQLSTLHEQILRGSPELDGPAPLPLASHAASSATPASATTAPNTLPYDLPDFTGRKAELHTLLAHARQETGDSAPRIIAVDGMGGCGKTTLAIRAAHRLADAFPDGQLYIDLRGHTPGEQPLEPSPVIAASLRALGVPDSRIPEDIEGRTALWRATLADRRLMLLLDNAVSSAQIRPLLLASPGSLVMITSRGRLVDIDGARWISLGVMPPEDSLTLLTRMLGTERTAAAPEATAELAELCGHLPLALQIASARLNNRPHWMVHYLVGRLRNEARRLTELSSGERSVESAIRFSYQELDEVHRRVLRLLGMYSGPHIDAHSAAALLGMEMSEAEDSLEHLLDMHLLQQHEFGLYTFHDLVRSFAHTLRDDTTAQEDIAAFERLLNYYLAATEKACEIIFPGRANYTWGIMGEFPELPSLETVESASQWFDREHSTLLTILNQATEKNVGQQVVHLARNVVFYLHLRGRLDEYLAVGLTAVAAARALGDPLALSLSLANLAAAQADKGMFLDAIASAEESRELATSLDDNYQMAFSLDLLGLIHSDLGHLPQAQHYLEAGVLLHRKAGNNRREATALCNLSSVHAWLGRYPEAAAAAEHAAVLCERLGNRESEVAALNDLAIAHLGLGEHEEALRVLDRAIGLSTENRVPQNLALTLALAADVCDRLGLPERRPDSVRFARDLVREKGTTMWRSRVENVLGRLRRRQGALTEAADLHESAYRSAAEIGHRIEMAYALDGLSEIAVAQGDSATAARHRERADDLFAALGIIPAWQVGHDALIQESKAKA